ncbi:MULTISPECIES: putative ABC transporter permease [unclassified Adlercreutzia]|uniref:putative ABC transporter permease n=1 Tax=unclassified Adlercreutzia TaxID=2636013 RepID=UPI0013ED91A4|nr:MULTISPECIES: putative ABC transporter permease [unclassified Adlercreutzia]
MTNKTVRDVQCDTQCEPDQTDPSAAHAAAPDEAVDPASKRFPWPFKLFGVLCLILGASTFVFLGVIVTALVLFLLDGSIDGTVDATAVTIMCLQVAVELLLSLMQIRIGYRLLRNHRRDVARTAYVISGLLAVSLVLSVMTNGPSEALILPTINLGVFVLLSSYADPALREERQLRRKLRSMEDRADAEEGVLGRDKTGEGYIALDFFNLFWIFVVCCFLGLVIELVYHMTVVDFGHYQDRAGLLYGPFSPIYGVGATLLTIALNRFYDRNVFMIFVVSAIVGGAFEFFVSWFMQYAFGIQAWDYSGTFLNIDGRTNFKFMCMWGVLGVIWIKLCLPRLLKLVNLIPWNLRYVVTAVCAALMIVDCTLTLVAFDRWYGRIADRPAETAIEYFVDEHYDNDYMAERFQTMTINPDEAIRG